MKNKIIKLFLASTVIVLASCESYLDVNDTPNAALLSQITPDLALAAAQSQTNQMITGNARSIEGDINATSVNRLGNLLMNSWAGNVNTFTDPFGNEYRSFVTTTFYSGIWDFGYRNIANLDNIANYDSDNYDNHKAIAKILKSFYMQTIVDLYGDCPYSQAFLGNENLAPAYDDDSVIYRALYDELDAAIALINSANSSDLVVGGEDVMCAGDMDKWKRFANSIKLRLLVRQSDLTDANTVSYVTAKLTALATENFIVNDVTLNPGFSIASTEKQNPFYATYGFTISGAISQNRNLVLASKHAADKLNSTSDPRRGRLFVPVAGNVVGIVQGESAAAAADNASALGAAIIPTATAVGSVMDSYVMTTSEVNFLLAEAAIKYPSIITGSAQTYFDDAIASSFVRLGATLGTYLTDIDSVPGFGWSATANKVEAIMTQKWIALMSVNAGESWIDYVRTGFPVTPDALINPGVGKPKRLLYPNSEKTTNAANSPVQSSASAFATGPFWKI